MCLSERWKTLNVVLLLTYVGVAHDQRSLGVSGLQLDQILQGGGGHPGHPLPTEGLRLLARRLRHQLDGDAIFIPWLPWLPAARQERLCVGLFVCLCVTLRWFQKSLIL